MREVSFAAIECCLGDIQNLVCGRMSRTGRTLNPIYNETL